MIQENHLVLVSRFNGQNKKICSDRFEIFYILRNVINIPLLIFNFVPFYKGILVFVCIKLFFPNPQKTYVTYISRWAIRRTKIVCI